MLAWKMDVKMYMMMMIILIWFGKSSSHILWPGFEIVLHLYDVLKVGGHVRISYEIFCSRYGEHIFHVFTHVIIFFCK